MMQLYTNDLSEWTPEHILTSPSREVVESLLSSVEQKLRQIPKLSKEDFNKSKGFSLLAEVSSLSKTMPQMTQKALGKGLQMSRHSTSKSSLPLENSSDISISKPRPTCLQQGCSKKALANGVCPQHWASA